MEFPGLEVRYANLNGGVALERSPLCRLQTSRSGKTTNSASQEWEEGKRFGGQIVVEKKEEALRTAKEWNRPDMVWTDGSRQDRKSVV